MLQTAAGCPGPARGDAGERDRCTPCGECGRRRVGRTIASDVMKEPLCTGRWGDSESSACGTGVMRRSRSSSSARVRTSPPAYPGAARSSRPMTRTRRCSRSAPGEPSRLQPGCMGSCDSRPGPCGARPRLRENPAPHSPKPGASLTYMPGVASPCFS
jgi:hypothetical protein